MSGMPEKGYLRNYRLSSMLVYLNRNRVTGTLAITSQGIIKRVFLQKGTAVFASSNYEDDRLGEMLVKVGLITMQQYDEAVKQRAVTHKRVGSILVELGYLSPKDLFWGVKYQVQEIIYSLFKLRDGHYEFEEGGVPSEVITLDLSMANIILEGLRRVDDLTRIKAELPEISEVFMLSDNPRDLFQDFALSVDERYILSLVDGERSISELIEHSRLSNFNTLKTLYVLWSVGLITEQFNLQMSGLSIDEILSPVDDQKEEFIHRVNAVHTVLDTLTPYQLLSVSRGADFDTITRQYYKLTKEFHPDRYPDIQEQEVKDRIAAIFDALAGAYNDLKRRQLARQFTEGDVALAEALLKNAKAEITAGNFPEAEKYLQEAVRANPDNAECWNYLSLALSKMPGRFEQAEEAIVFAEGLNPRSDDYVANRGLLYMQVGRTEEAQEQFDRAIEMNPANKKAQSGLARILQAKQQREQAAGGQPQSGQ